MNLRTLTRSVAKYQGTQHQGEARGSTGALKGPARPIRPGFRDLGGTVTWAKRPRRPDVERVQLPAMEIKPATWWSRAKATARNVTRALRRAVAP